MRWARHDRTPFSQATWTGLVLAALTAAAYGEFNPAREFPTSWDTVQVFSDQLPTASMSAAQRQFAATHYAGTQKQTSRRIGELRVYNPDFLMIQYRLGVRASLPNFIHNDTWSNDFPVIDAHEDWFIHDDQGNRVYQLYAGRVEEYVMDISGSINGNMTDGWKEYAAQTMIADADASDADGVFADSTHLPYAVPSSLHDSPIGGPPHTAYIDDMEAYYDWVYPQFVEADKYFIPNIGALTTTLDRTTGYYEDVHGAMVEGFGTRLSNFDWRQQSNRTLNLLRNDKIWIGQSTVADHNDVSGRLWYLANFLLLRHDKSFINLVSGAEGTFVWWPEYDLELGAPMDESVPDSVTRLADPSGIYHRDYEDGLVLVNPTGSARTYNLPTETEYDRVDPFGGGAMDASTAWLRPTGIQRNPLDDDITLDPWSAAILLRSAPLLGDMDRNGVVDYDDVDDFALGLSDTATYEDLHGVAASLHGDINADSLFDYDDIGPFVTILTGAAVDGAQHAVPEAPTIALVAWALLAVAVHSSRGKASLRVPGDVDSCVRQPFQADRTR